MDHPSGSRAIGRISRGRVVVERRTKLTTRSSWSEVDPV